MSSTKKEKAFHPKRFIIATTVIIVAIQMISLGILIPRLAEDMELGSIRQEAQIPREIGALLNMATSGGIEDIPKHGTGYVLEFSSGDPAPVLDYNKVVRVAKEIVDDKGDQFLYLLLTMEGDPKPYLLICTLKFEPDTRSKTGVFTSEGPVFNDSSNSLVKLARFDKSSTIISVGLANMSLAGATFMICLMFGQLRWKILERYIFKR